MSARLRRPGTANSQTPNECVQVVVRCRPISNREQSEGSEEVVSVYPNRGVVEITNLTEANKEQTKMFTYDAAYDASASQINLYNEVVFPLVSSVLEGFNGCIFAYGQTGTGKTFTMEGVRGNNELQGIIPRTFEQIWLHINRTENFQFLVDVSYLEIYMEELRDLLKPNSKHLEVRERGSGVYVPNLHAINCKSVDDMLNVMHIGNKNRTVGFTNMNEHSSRSHAIFMIRIEMCDIETNTIKVGKLNLIDLAGSERQSKTGASAERLKEASKINLALSSLGNVISALAENSPHVPYRDSKLTRLLQDSLGGNSKTIMIANIGPSSYNYNETLTTLRYASRAKTIQNKPVKNEDPQDAKLKEYQEEIERLKRLIAPKQQQRTEKIGKKRQRKPKKEKASNEVVQMEVEESEEEPESDKENEAEAAKSNEELERERVETAKLATKLAELESQLVRGGKNLLDTYSERQLELEKKLVEIAERKKREIEIQQQLELQEETTLEIKETVTSLEQEVELKKRKLSKCYAKYLALQQELNDCKYDHNQDLRELEMAQNELVKELKRQLLIIDNFVPVEVKQRLYTQAKYDEEQEEWKFSSVPLVDSNFLNKRPVSYPQRRRPISEYALMEAKTNTSSSLRFKNENIVSYELEMPCRTTQEYRSPKVSASLQAVLAQAMQTGDDIDIVDSHTNSIRSRLENIINASANATALASTNNSPTTPNGVGVVPVAGPRNIKPSRSTVSPGSAIDSNRRPPTGRTVPKKPASAYPKARGLVNK
ncbi:kinesin-like protein Klp68D [Anastrepha ludens]|uniref:kinesin-like protein Klp68D n=1 Tax=Anastrepha ludens TaxID=28586 RepID=UPI0023AEAB8E|nr:kinesin-like protein Klp68D [Anastrepha ludens]XP_053960732.1 kinesin-like protein Klp68D [Anastrepha ludens]XP_053960734.1 kinesin-like protein Klp68D [Anastrepha ludens]